MNETLKRLQRHSSNLVVDFDPVRAKVEGRPTGFSKEINDLFPDSFEDSELGKFLKITKLEN